MWGPDTSVYDLPARTVQLNPLLLAYPNQALPAGQAPVTYVQMFPAPAGPAAPAAANGSSFSLDTLQTWLERHKTAVYIGSAALLALAIFGGQARR